MFYESPNGITLKDDNLYLFGEKMLIEYEDEYLNHYIKTYGFRFYTLYKQQLNGSFAIVATGINEINTYVKENNLYERKRYDE